MGGAAARARDAQRDGAPGRQPAGVPDVRGAGARLGRLHRAPGRRHRPRRPHRCAMPWFVICNGMLGQPSPRAWPPSPTSRRPHRCIVAWSSICNGMLGGPSPRAWPPSPTRTASLVRRGISAWCVAAAAACLGGLHCAWPVLYDEGLYGLACVRGHAGLCDAVACRAQAACDAPAQRPPTLISAP